MDNIDQDLDRLTQKVNQDLDHLQATVQKHTDQMLVDIDHIQWDINAMIVCYLLMAILIILLQVAVWRSGRIKK